MSTSSSETPFPVVVQAVSDSLKADVILINHPINEDVATSVTDQIALIENKHENVFVILATFGGDANAAYLIGRNLQRCYEKVTICIGGDCYSAGTLIVLCAHELVIADTGKLGPLDVQLVKRDELLERVSGLTGNTALSELRTRAFETFVAFAKDLKQEFGYQISFRTAMDMAANVTSSLYGEVYKQIDPIKLGDDARALNVARHYGERLGKASANLKEGAIERLVKGYPAHDCIIDRAEASELFINVRSPSKEEADLIRYLGMFATNAYKVWGCSALPNMKEKGPNEDDKSDGDEANINAESSEAPGTESASSSVSDGDELEGTAETPGEE